MFHTIASFLVSHLRDKTEEEEEVSWSIFTLSHACSRTKKSNSYEGNNCMHFRLLKFSVLCLACSLSTEAPLLIGVAARLYLSVRISPFTASLDLTFNSHCTTDMIILNFYFWGCLWFGFLPFLMVTRTDIMFARQIGIGTFKVLSSLLMIG